MKNKYCRVYHDERLGITKVLLLDEEWDAIPDDEKKEGLANGIYEEVITTINPR